MPTINCHIPIKVRITGRPSDAQLDELGETLLRVLTERLAIAERTIQGNHANRMSHRSVELIRQPSDTYDVEKEDTSGEYILPSYDDRGSLKKVMVWHRHGEVKGLNAGPLGRATMRLPTGAVNWLVDYWRETDKGAWVNRLTIDLATVIPEVDVTFELWRLAYPGQDLGGLVHIFLHELRNKSYTVMYLTRVRDIRILESDFNLNLNKLFRATGTPLPEKMTAEEQDEYLVFVYVAFGTSVEQYLEPESVLEAIEAVQGAAGQQPIGALGEILKNPENFKKQLEGPDDKLVVVLQGTDRQVISLRVLRKSIAQIQEARRNPWLLGFFERSLSEHDKRSFEKMLNLQQGFLDTRSVYFQFISVTNQGGGKLTVKFQSEWLFPDRLDFQIRYHDLTGTFAEDTIIALQIGGPTARQPAPAGQGLDLLVPVASLPDVLEKIQSAWRSQVLLRGGFQELEHFTEALTIYFAISTLGKLATAGGAGLATLREAGLKALTLQLGRGLATKAGLALAGDVALNLLLPSVSFYVQSNRDELEKTSAGKNFVTAVDLVNKILLAYGVTRLALGGLRLVKLRIAGLARSAEQAQMASQVDALIAQAEKAALRESEAAIAAAALEQGAASQVLTGPDDASLLAAADREAELVRRAILAETKQGFERYTDALAGRLRLAGQSEEQIAAVRRALESLNEARRTAAVQAMAPDLLKRAADRVAELSDQAAFTAEAEARAAELSKLSESSKPRENWLRRWLAAPGRAAQETAALQNEVTNSRYLRRLTAEGGGPILRRLWTQFRARPKALTSTFEEYVRILQRHFRGHFGEFEVAFRLGDRFVLLKPPDNFVTAPGTDLIAIPRGGGDVLLIDNKALEGAQLDAVSALTRNLPNNLVKDLDQFAKLAGQTALPAEFSQAVTRMQAASAQIQPIIKGLSKAQIDAPAIQQQIDTILRANGIRRVIANAGGNVQGLSSELQAIGIDLVNLN